MCVCMFELALHVILCLHVRKQVHDCLCTSSSAHTDCHILDKVKLQSACLLIQDDVFPLDLKECQSLLGCRTEQLTMPHSLKSCATGKNRKPAITGVPALTTSNVLQIAMPPTKGEVEKTSVTVHLLRPNHPRIVSVVKLVEVVVQFSARMKSIEYLRNGLTVGDSSTEPKPLNGRCVRSRYERVVCVSVCVCVCARALSLSLCSVSFSVCLSACLPACLVSVCAWLCSLGLSGSTHEGIPIAVGSARVACGLEATLCAGSCCPGLTTGNTHTHIHNQNIPKSPGDSSDVLPLRCCPLEDMDSCDSCVAVSILRQKSHPRHLRNSRCTSKHHHFSYSQSHVSNCACHLLS